MCRSHASFVSLLVVGLVGLAACGEATDRPQDCRESEFYNQQTGRCVSCPAISPPECAEGCGWEVYEGDNGCKRARCAPECRTCEVGSRYSREEGVCEPCPGRPDCDELTCEGELRVVGEYRGACPDPSAFACGECRRPGQQCGVDEDGNCVDPDE